MANEVCSDDILAKIPTPCEWSKERIIQYVIQEEAMTASTDGGYCGHIKHLSTYSIHKEYF